MLLRGQSKCRVFQGIFKRKKTTIDRFVLSTLACKIPAANPGFQELPFLEVGYENLIKLNIRCLWLTITLKHRYLISRLSEISTKMEENQL
jgi:hypothetical protein